VWITYPHNLRNLCLTLLLLPALAHADVDWASGLVTAAGVGIADRHAPNPAVARGTSRRGAEDAAKKKLADEIAALPVALGGKVADIAKVETPVAARLAAAVDHAVTVSAEPETDGAWRVTLAVPIEAVRQALAGPRTLPAAGDQDVPVAIVDGVGGKPAVGALDAATIWVKAVPAWAKDAPHVTGKGAKGRIEGITPAPATLYVIVGK
jgi:hypothetical protein